MSAPLIHTQIDRRDGEDVWFRFTLSQLPASPWKLHFCLARHIDPQSVEGGSLARQSGSYKVLVPDEGVSELRFCCRNTPIKRYSDLPQGFFLSLTDQGAQAQLQPLLEVWLQGMQPPLPLPLRTALALAGELQTGKPADLANVYEGDEPSPGFADVSDPCLARLYPDFDSLEADDRFRALTEAVFLPLLDWVQTHVQAQPSASA